MRGSHPLLSALTTLFPHHNAKSIHSALTTTYDDKVLPQAPPMNNVDESVSGASPFQSCAATLRCTTNRFLIVPLFFPFAPGGQKREEDAREPSYKSSSLPKINIAFFLTHLMGVSWASHGRSMGYS